MIESVTETSAAKELAQTALTTLPKAPTAVKEATDYVDYGVYLA